MADKLSPSRPSDASASLTFSELMEVPPTRAATGNYKQLFVTPTVIRRQNLSPEQVRQRINAGETLRLRRSLLGEIPLMGVFILSIYFVYALLPYSFSPGTSLALCTVPLSVLFALIHRIYDRRYTISAEEIIISRGHLRYLIRRAPVKFQQVRGIEITQSIIQRLFKVGHLQVSSAMLDDPEFIMEGIHNPSFYYTVLDLKLKELLPAPPGATLGGPGADPSPSVQLRIHANHAARNVKRYS